MGRSQRTGRAGFTLIELMVGLVVASIAVGFIFRIYATCSVAYRTQSQLAEVMQSLRTAKQVITKRLRNAGYMATAGASTMASTGTSSTSTAGIYMFNPIHIVNSSTGPDELYLSYADTGCEAHVSTCAHGACPFNSAETNVDSTSCFAEGDVVVAVRTGGANRGQACVLQITHVQDQPGKLQHHPADPYNDTHNDQCHNVAYVPLASGGEDDVFSDGNTYFMRFRSEGYRIKPSDARGVLQHSDSGGVVDDWQDIAFGFVDMQFALQTVTSTKNLTTGATTYSYGWLSSNNMSTFTFGSTTTTSGADTIVTTTAAAQIRVNLLARTVAEVEGAGTAVTPSMLGSPATTNPIGDRGSVTTSTVTNTSSPYYGNYVYRMVSTVVDLRNVGTGSVQ